LHKCKSGSNDNVENEYGLRHSLWKAIGESPLHKSERQKQRTGGWQSAPTKEFVAACSF